MRTGTWNLAGVAISLVVALVGCNQQREVDQATEGEGSAASEKLDGTSGPGHGAGRMAMFAQADRDGDGKLTREEAQSAAGRRFKSADKNGDGTLDDQELSALRARGMGAPGKGPRDASRFRQMDKNGDGTLSKDEVPGFLADRFDDIDADHDGKVTHDELRAAHVGKGPGGGMGFARGWRFQQMDKNGDGVVGKDEATARLAQRFDVLDADHDGKLTHGELRAGRRRGFGYGGGFADVDGDGKVTLQEMTDAASKQFARADANGDGVVTAEEVRAARPMLHGR
ncbi:MAG: EF-hand domain-containing protein [Polyangiaceae bacterium]|jgi:Ca2+-binding EF-hand superfamily protein|nr:EF-hand domain-containing protein [Polyangiaceae bacterium]